MQAPFSCLPATFDEIETAISAPRLRRFLPEAKGDKHLALRLYVWNARLCEEFYLPIQTAEVLIRNRISEVLKSRFGAGWYSSQAVSAMLSEQHRKELDALVRREQLGRGILFTGDHVVSGLSFGFWANWLTVSYAHYLWQGGMGTAFPHAPQQIDRQTAYEAIDQLRRFRNLVMHHRAIFDRWPTAEYQNIVKIIGWISPATVWLLAELSSPPRVLNAKPRI